MRMFLRAMMALSALCLLQSLVLAGTLTVASSGVFASSGIPTTTWSAPSDTWSFSFSILDTPVVSNADSVGFDIPITGFSYLLNGGLTPTPARIRFFVLAGGGLFQINFVDTSTPPDGFPGTGFVFDGPQAFLNTTANPSIPVAAYTPTGVFFYSGGTVASQGNVTNTGVNITSSGSGVPEPGTCAIVAAACCLFGWMRRGQKII